MASAAVDQLPRRYRAEAYRRNACKSGWRLSVLVLRGRVAVSPAKRDLSSQQLIDIYFGRKGGEDAKGIVCSICAAGRKPRLSFALRDSR